MKKVINRIRNKFSCLARRTCTAVGNPCGDFYISDAVKIIIAVVRGNWRNAIFIDCAGCPRHSCPGFLLTADAEGRLLLLPVDEFKQFSGQRVEKEECRGILSRQAFEAAFSLYLEWHTPSARDCGLRQLCAEKQG